MAIDVHCEYDLSQVSIAKSKTYQQIFRGITFIWAIVLLFVLPDTIQSASFLNEDEKRSVEFPVNSEGTGTLDPLVTRKWKRYQVREVLSDPKTWVFFASYFLTQISNGGLQNFGNLVARGLGFSSLDTVLFGIPASVIAGVTIWVSGWLSTWYRNISIYLISGVSVPPVVGAAIIYTQDGKGVRLFGYYLLQTAYASNPLALGLVTSNFKGATKKMTVTAILFLGYCVGNISGPQFFITKEAPKYGTGFRAVISTFALAVAITLLFRVYLLWKHRSNGQRTSEENPPGVDEMLEADITDFEAKHFIYRM